MTTPSCAAIRSWPRLARSTGWNSRITNRPAVTSRPMIRWPSPTACSRWACAVCPGTRAKSCSTSTRWATSSTARRRGGTSAVITTARRARCLRWRKSWRRSAIALRTRGSSCGAMRVFAGGNPGLVRVPAGSLLLSGPGEKLRDGRALAARAGGRAGAAFTVSYTHIEPVKECIRTQEEHHGQTDSVEELKRLLETNGVEYKPEYLV